MKKLLLFALFACLSNTLFAQSPRTISYQGMIRGMNGNHSITLTLYSDAAGTQKLWQATTNTILDSSGVFNTMLGSEGNPLPDAARMDRQLWLGVSIDGAPELRPLSELTASPYALNVADSSITSNKLNTNYVSSISVNGQPITGKGTNINIVPGPGLNATWVPTSSSLVLTGTGRPDTGNKVDFIATNPCGTNSDGSVSTNTVSGGCGNQATAATGYATIGGGDTNIASGEYATVGGGASNNAYGESSTIAGGGNNSADADAFIGGGGFNIAGQEATIAGGDYNWASYLGSVGGGRDDTALWGGTVGGGAWNHADTVATVGGGATNKAKGTYSTIGGGTQSFAYDSASTVAGGYSNQAYKEGAVGGGAFNRADTLSAIPGGYQLTLANNSFGFNAPGGGPLSILTPNVAYFGNVNLWLSNNDNAARQLRFYAPTSSPSSTSGFTSFQSSLSSSTIQYVLPPYQASDSGQVLTNDGAGNLSWGTPWAGAAGSWSISGNSSTTPPTNFLGTNDSNSLELHIFNTGSSSYGDKRVMGFYLNSTSANIIGGFHDNAVSGSPVGIVIAGGGSSGHVNLVKGSYGAISGGRENTDSSYSFVGGGDSNRAIGAYSSVVGGDHNLNEGDSSVIAGGNNNLILKSYTSSEFDSLPSGTDCFVGAGNHNKVGGLGEGPERDPTINSAVVAGSNNIATEKSSFIGGGDYNQALDDELFIGAGFINVIVRGPTAGIVTGQNNEIIGGLASFIGAGQGNIDSSGQNLFLGAGTANSATGFNGSVVAGDHNHVVTHLSSFSVDSTDLAGNNAGILAGQGLTAQSFAQTVLGFYNITQGESVDPERRHPNDRILIIGNGLPDTVFTRSGIHYDSARHSNAFEVMNKGTSIVYCTNGSGGATPNGFPPAPDSAVIYGARYMDNTPLAWGKIEGFSSSAKPWLPTGGDTVYGDFGVASVNYKGLGKYEVTLNTVDSYTGNPITSFSDVSIVATIEHIGLAAPSCLLALVTQTAPGSNVFTIWVMTASGCSQQDACVNFQVFGRR